MGQGEDDDVVDNLGGGELWHRKQRHRCQQVHLRGGGSVFLPLLDASIFGGSITSSFFNMFVFQVSDNLNILFSSDKSFIGKKRRLSIIK